MRKEAENLTYAVLKAIKQKESQFARNIVEKLLGRKPSIREVGNIHRVPNEDNSVDLFFKGKRLGKIVYEMQDKTLSLTFHQ